MKYADVKALLWPHVALPLFLVVAIDYVKIVGTITQALAGFYLSLQLLAFLLGFVAAAVLQLGGDNHWAHQVFLVNASRFFPLLGAGKRSFDFLMAEPD